MKEQSNKAVVQQISTHPCPAKIKTTHYQKVYGLHTFPLFIEMAYDLLGLAKLYRIKPV